MNIVLSNGEIACEGTVTSYDDMGIYVHNDTYTFYYPWQDLSPETVKEIRGVPRLTVYELVFEFEDAFGDTCSESMGMFSTREAARQAGKDFLAANEIDPFYVTILVNPWEIDAGIQSIQSYPALLELATDIRFAEENENETGL